MRLISLPRYAKIYTGVRALKFMTKLAVYCRYTQKVSNSEFTEVGPKMDSHTINYTPSFQRLGTHVPRHWDGFPVITCMFT